MCSCIYTFSHLNWEICPVLSIWEFLKNYPCIERSFPESYLIPHRVQISPLKLNMSLYSHLSQPQYRRCDITTDVCPTFPCILVPCQDPDYLADYEEFLANTQVH